MDLLGFSSFERLLEEAQRCEKCPQMCRAQKVLSWANGLPSARVMFIAEAPGRLGADRTMIPLHGDKSGDNFEKLLSASGFDRRTVFVTNSVLCNPQDIDGNNRPPSSDEIRNCSDYLQRQISVVDPQIVVTLGAKALSALELIEPHGIGLSDGVRKMFDWWNRKLIPLYHPGTRALIHRNFHNQIADYYFVAEHAKRLSRKAPPSKQAAARRGSSDSWSVVAAVLRAAGETSLFKLHKLMYLVDNKHLETQGELLTDFYYLRQKDGPYCVNLTRGWAKGLDFDIRERTIRGSFYYSTDDGMFAPSLDLSPEAITIVDEIVTRFADYDESAIKTAAYLTKPMKTILRAERAGRPMLNAPIFAQ